MRLFGAQLLSPHVLTGLTGALGLWLGFPNDGISLPPLVLLYPCALALLGFNAPDRAAAFRRGWLTGLIGGMAALYWLTLPIHNVGGLPWVLAAAAALFATACISSAGGFFALAAYLLRTRGPALRAVQLGLFWYILEELYSLVPAFPWLPLSGALVAWPATVQAADTVGAYAVGGLWVTAALLCLAALCPQTGGQPRSRLLAAPPAPADKLERLPQRRGLNLAAGLLTAGLLLGYGVWQLHALPLNDNPQGANSFPVLFVEGNIDQNQKWLPAFQRRTVDLYLSLTQAALDERPGEKPLIIWPETALPFFFERNTLHTPRIRELVARAQSPLLTGAPGVAQQSGGKDKVFNRAFLLGPDGSTRSTYDKEHLVPFGEYVPDWLNWEIFSALLQEVGIYEPGTASAPLRTDDLALGMLICYEGIFPQLAQERVADGATVLVDISNDGWFGDSPAPLQHLYLTALRGLEQNRWVLRGTNTGISAVTDTRGRITMQGSQFRAQALWARAAAVSAPSRYYRFAPWLLPGAILLFFGLLFCGRRSPSTPTIHHAASE